MSNKKIKIDKPIRLIELFAGYGSQSLALKYLGVPFESYRICEWAAKSIEAYKDLHFENDNQDYSQELSFDDVVNYLYGKGVSLNYNEPAQKSSIRIKGEKQCRKIYNSIISTHNLVNIQNAKAQDLNIVSTDKYTYIMTYSFPCQDLSNTGGRKGMAKGGGTRSGMLWEVERLLNDSEELPQILLMENVAQVHSKKNIEHFTKWIEFLESKGYKNFWKDINSKDFGIPQSRKRTYMISILGDYDYKFPKEKPLDKLVKDFIEKDVDEKFYLKDKTIKRLFNQTFYQNKYEYKVAREYGIIGTLCARDWKDPKCVQIGELKNGGKIRKLIPREYFRFMGVKDNDFDKVSANQSNTSLYHLAGDSIVVNVLMAIFKQML